MLLWISSTDPTAKPLKPTKLTNRLDSKTKPPQSKSKNPSPKKRKVLRTITKEVRPKEEDEIGQRVD